MEENQEYQVILTKQAKKLFRKIKDRREQKLLKKILDNFEQD